jgi:hypothetical protein
MLKSIRKIKERRKTSAEAGTIRPTGTWENKGRTAKPTNHNADGGKMAEKKKRFWQLSRALRSPEALRQ